jgi:hypothetical protein
MKTLNLLMAAACLAAAGAHADEYRSLFVNADALLVAQADDVACTMEYAPVCAQVQSGEMKTYSSACNACADDTVGGYLSGACPEDE